MANKQFGVFVSPLHMAVINADSLEENGARHLVLKRGEETVAYFRDWSAWIEHERERDPASILSIVPGGNPKPAPPGGEAA